MSQRRAPGAQEAAPAAESSYWPIVLAATLILTLTGLLVNLGISIVGAVLSVAAMVAWGTQRFHGPSEVEDHGPTETVSVPAQRPGELGAGLAVSVGRSAGWWGIVWFIATEATFFAFLIAGYVYIRAISQSWPPPGTPHRELFFPSLNTVILLLSGVPAYFAHRAILRGDRKGLQIGLVLAVLLGAIFLGGQGYEYLTAGVTPQTNLAAAGFFVLTGFHGAHVAAGIGLLLVVLGLSLRGRFSPRHHFGVQFASTYWHFVDAVWIFLFTVLYLLQ